MTAPASFIQRSKNDTEQFSQEFRVAWQFNESINLTSGLLYWHEEVDQFSNNSTTILGGPECYVQPVATNVNGDATTNPFPVIPYGFALGTVKDQCGNTGLPAAYWAAETYQGRLDQGGNETNRETDHFSWYGSVDWNITDKFSTRLEARFTREDNEVTGLVQNPCLDSSLRIGEPGCLPPAALLLLPPQQGAGGQPTGPSLALICGQVGRCDTLGIIPALANTGPYPLVPPPNIFNPGVGGSYDPQLGYTYTTPGQQSAVTATGTGATSRCPATRKLLIRRTASGRPRRPSSMPGTMR